MKRKLVAAIACRNQGSRLYGKPLQNLDIADGITILDNIIDCLQSLGIIDEVVLGISEGVENEVFKKVAQRKNVGYIVGDEKNVLQRLIQCGEYAAATDIFRVTSESPFLYFEPVRELWKMYTSEDLDAVFYDEVIDGSGFEIISLAALKTSHNKGEPKHRSEFCTLYLRENIESFRIKKVIPASHLIRKDLRLTVDNPEDLVVCRKVYQHFKHQAPLIPVEAIVAFLDQNPGLKELIAPFVESGYSTMNL